MQIAENAEKYLTKTEDDLYDQLGAMYKPNSAFTATTIDFTKRGKKRFSELQEKLFEFLCVENQMCEKIEKFAKSDVLALFGIVSGLLVVYAMLPTWIPIGIIAAIIVKQGIRKFCQC